MFGNNSPCKIYVNSIKFQWALDEISDTRHKKDNASFHITWSKILPIVISCLALVVSIFVLILNYISTENSVRPLIYVSIGDSRNPSTLCYGLVVRNNGMGPARIKSVDYLFAGAPIKSVKDLSRAIAQGGFPGRPIDFEIIAVPFERDSILGLHNGFHSDKNETQDH